MTNTLNIKNGKWYVNILPKESKLEDVIDHYIKIYKSTTENTIPDIILVSNKQFPEEIEILGVKLIPVRNVSINNFWIGQRNGDK